MSTGRVPATDVELTAATMADIDFLFDLTSEPESVYWGGFARPPEYAALRRHYEKLIQEGTKTILIVRRGEMPVGFIRYRFDEVGDCVDHSTNISRCFAGQGLGRSALARNIALLEDTRPSCRRIVALIRDDNLGSQRMFRACGFVMTNEFEERQLDSDSKIIRLHVWVRDLA